MPGVSTGFISQLMPLTLLVVEDDPAISLALVDFFEAEGYVVVTAVTGEEALHLLHEYRPHLLLADITLPIMDGYELVRQVRRLPAYRLLPVIFLTARERVADRIRGYQLGCDVYVAKPFSLSELAAIVRNLLDRSQIVQSELAARVSMAPEVSTDSSQKPQPNEPVVVFTERETQVLQWLCHGFSNRQIGLQLRLSPRTIEKYVSRLLQKTETSNRAELVRFAMDHQLITLPELKKFDTQS